MSRHHWSVDKLFSRLLHNTSRKTYWDNIQQLQSRHTEIDLIAQQCHHLLLSDNLHEKIIAIDVLAQLGEKNSSARLQVVKYAFNLLKSDKQPQLITALLYAISHNNDALKLSQLHTIVPFKTHPVKQVRLALTFALSGVNQATAIKTLLELMHDNSGDVRNWATFAIGTLCQETDTSILNALWQNSTDKHLVTRHEAFVGLAKRQIKTIEPLIKKDIIDGQFSEFLFDAITTLADKKMLPFLIETLSQHQQQKTAHYWLTCLENCIDLLKND